MNSNSIGGAERYLADQVRSIELRYFRDVDRREVDFVVVEGRASKQAPILLVECKWGDAEVDSSLIYLKNKFPSTPAWQVSAVGHKDYLSKDGIRVAPAIELLMTLT